MRDRKIGLTLGKFAPLHKGHQLLIETAVGEMDELLLIIYDSKLTDIPLPVRAQWIRELYPSVIVMEAWGGPERHEYADEREYEMAEETFIARVLARHEHGGKVTHFYCSEPYGEHVSRSLGAVDRRVDEARRTFPISGTMIRQNPSECRAFLAPRVYRDLITRVVVLGAMSTGKSTLTEALAQHYGTVHMPEYGREYWESHQVNRRLSLNQLDEIALEHVWREDELAHSAHQYLFCDTNALTTRLFCLDYHGCSTAVLDRLSAQCGQRYDVVFLCEDDIPYDDTWDRSGDQKRHVFQRMVIADLLTRNITFVRLRGSLAERLATAVAWLANDKKYRR